MTRAPQDEKLSKLRQSVAQPLPVAVRHANHGRRHHDELVGLKILQRSGLGLADAGRGQQERRRNSEHEGETREDRRSWLLNTTGFELRDRGTRHTNPVSELSLSEPQTLAGRTHR